MNFIRLNELTTEMIFEITLMLFSVFYITKSFLLDILITAAYKKWQNRPPQNIPLGYVNYFRQ